MIEMPAFLVGGGVTVRVGPHGVKDKWLVILHKGGAQHYLGTFKTLKKANSKARGVFDKELWS